jgi:protein-disulfide isomerase
MKEKTEEKENKEKKCNESKENKKKKSFPWMIAVLFIIMVVFAALAINKILFQEEKKDEWKKEETPAIEIKNFYSSECSFCEKENSIIANFKARNIKIKVESIDLTKKENKHYIQEFNLEMVPTALVKAKDLAEYPLEENLIKESFKEINGYFVIPESYLDGKPHNIMLLKEKCESEKGKVFIEEFSDYRCLGCALIIEPTKKARQKFAGEMIFKHKNYLLHGEESEIPALAAECARKQGRFFEFKRYLYEKSFPQAFDINRTPTDNFLPSVIRTGTLLVQMPDMNAFNSCIKEQEPLEKIKEETELAKAYKAHYAPTLVFDCKYVVQGYQNILEIEDIVCSLHPELKECNKK